MFPNIKNVSFFHYWEFFKSSHQGCSVKKVFLEISSNSQEYTSAKVAILSPATLLKKRLWHRCFPVNFFEVFKNTFVTEHLWTTASVVSIHYIWPNQRLVEPETWSVNRKTFFKNIGHWKLVPGPFHFLTRSYVL